MAWSRKSQVESRKSNVEVHASAFAYDAIVVLASPGKKGESKGLPFCIPQIPGQSELRTKGTNSQLVHTEKTILNLQVHFL